MASSGQEMTGSANGSTSHGDGAHLAVGSLADERAFNHYHMSSFMAMEVPATIVPRFSMDRVDGLSGSYGPFAPNFPTQVPLWLALYLRQTDTCTIQPPEYLRMEYLRDVIERERTNDQGFESLPFYFYEIAKLLTEHGGGGGSADDGETIPHVVEVVRLVNEIHAMRQLKLKNLMTVFEAEGSPMFIPGVLLTNIVCHELHFLRSSFGIVLQQAASMERRRLKPVLLPHLSAASARPSSSVGGVTPMNVWSSTRTTTTSLSFGGLPGDGAATDLASQMDAHTSAHDGVVNSQGSTLTAATTAATTMAPAGGTQTTTSTDTTPLAQPAMKKRRTLRQT